MFTYIYVYIILVYSDMENSRSENMAPGKTQLYIYIYTILKIILLGYSAILLAVPERKNYAKF